VPSSDRHHSSGIIAIPEPVVIPAPSDIRLSLLSSFRYIQEQEQVLLAISRVNPILQILAKLAIPVSELRFRTSRSGGPGGQNVNKLETRVELTFDVSGSLSLTEDQKQAVFSALSSRIDSHGILHISSQKSRSQWENKQVTIQKFTELLRAALKPRRKRVKTAPTRSSKERRVQAKKKHGQKKQMRRISLSNE
jgi:ribosome-associated protein